jgi:aspartate/methionine/tyrosine aminotransferase
VFNEDTLAERLLDEEKISVIPGSAFDVAGPGFVGCSKATEYEKIGEAEEWKKGFVKHFGQFMSPFLFINRLNQWIQ